MGGGGERKRDDIAPCPFVMLLRESYVCLGSYYYLTLSMPSMKDFFGPLTALPFEVHVA